MFVYSLGTTPRDDVTMVIKSGDVTISLSISEIGQISEFWHRIYFALLKENRKS